MSDKRNALIIDKDKVPAGKIIGAFTFLRDMGETLGKNKAIQIEASDAQEAKKIQSRWRIYFKGRGHSRKQVSDDKITIYLWLES